jgi:16S rRNA (guanine966-N2)-methyltransferase
MRIVAGQWKGRTIHAPAGRRMRPTSDRVREAWMSIVQPWLEGARVLDLFAGSGALGLEALSRGAASADFVEVDPKHLAMLRENAESLGAGATAVVHRGDALRYAERLDPDAYDVAFADPPYDEGLAARTVELWLRAPFATMLGVEHRVSEHVPDGGTPHRYGTTMVTVYRSR